MDTRILDLAYDNLKRTQRDLNALLDDGVFPLAAARLQQTLNYVIQAQDSLLVLREAAIRRSFEDKAPDRKGSDASQRPPA